MNKTVIKLLICLLAPVALAVDDFVTIEGATCSRPLPLHCPDAECGVDRIINQGGVTEMETRRTYFLDYPCDLKPGEPVMFVLSLHGGGSYGNWQRHYFPILDFVDSHRLVVATPNSPIRVWTDADDQYLQNIVNFVVAQVGKENIRSFWLAGHSQGGMTSNRLLRGEFFSSQVDGWISLSGGRLGGNPGRAGFGAPPSSAQASNPSTSGQASSRPRMSESFRRSLAMLRSPLEADISFIYTTGEREADDNGVPATSSHAERLGCGARSDATRVKDDKPGYVYDASRQNPPNPAWGLLPGPGVADVYTFQGCKQGRIVADVVRREKGHTEGLETSVTKALVDLMVAAPGGKIQSL